jgi:hypothetical protein
MNLCIPRMKTTISKDYIHERLCNLKLGKIEKIIEIPLKNDPTHKRVLFRTTIDNIDTTAKLIDHLKDRGYINFVYDTPWYWKIVTTNQRI